MLYYICIVQKTIWMGSRTFDHNKTFIEEQIFNWNSVYQIKHIHTQYKTQKMSYCADRLEKIQPDVAENSPNDHIHHQTVAR